MQTPAPPTETSIATPAYARFKADHLKWVYAARNNLDSRLYLQKLLVEPAPEGGVYVVATNGALLMVAYDAEGTANSRFTFDVAEEIANMCGFPADEERLFYGSNYADTIVIDGDTLKACRSALVNPDVAPLTLLSQPAEIGHEYPAWQALIKASGPCNPVPAYVDSQLLEMAFTGLADTRAVVSFTRYITEGQDDARQPVHISFCGLPLRGLLMPLGSTKAEPAPKRHAMPFDAA